MNIEQVRAFLYAQDTTHIWDILRWLDDQTGLADHGREVAPAYDYLRGALTEDVRAVALDTCWAAIWAETQRVERTWIHPTKGETEWYGGVCFASSNNNARFTWVHVQDMSKRAPVYTQRIVLSHRAALDVLPKTLRWEFGARLAGCAEHMIRAVRDRWEAEWGTDPSSVYTPALPFEVVREQPEWAWANDRRRTVETRIGSFVICVSPTRDVPRAAFRAWATEEYARFCLAFLLGPARGSTSYLPPTRPYPTLA